MDPQNRLIRPSTKKVDTTPYIPKKRDYSFEIGSHWQQNTNYWLGGHFGWHTGRCLFTSSEICQHFVDALAGVGGRDEESHTFAALGLRIQWVNYPSQWSPFVRPFLGVGFDKDDSVTERSLIAGAGFGVIRHLHEKLDARFEVRVGHSDQIFSQAVFGIQIKIDRWVGAFAGKVKDFGTKTVKGTGRMLKKTIDATGEIIKETGSAVTSPFRQEKSNSSENSEEPKTFRSRDSLGAEKNPPTSE